MHSNRIDLADTLDMSIEFQFVPNLIDDKTS